MLTFLGIPFINRQYFWLANEADLEYLYDDFVKAAKVIKCRLHPDRGGNTESFARFSKHCSMVVNAFRKHGIDQRDTIIRLQEREDQICRAKAKASYKKGGKH